MQDAKRRAIIFAVISLFLAALAGFLFLQRVNAVEAQLGNETTVFVAKTDIQPRQPLKPEYFEVVPIPEKYVQQPVVTNLQQVGDYGGIDQYVAIVPLKKGDILSGNLLKPAKELATGGDKRLVYVPANERIVFDQPLEAYDRADIIVSWGGEGPNRTVIFATDVLVAAAASTGEEGKFSGVWLEMTLEEAKRLIDAQNFAASVRILKAPQQKSGSKVSVNQEIPENPGRGQEESNGKNVNPVLTPDDLNEQKTDFE